VKESVMRYAGAFFEMIDADASGGIGQLDLAHSHCRRSVRAHGGAHARMRTYTHARTQARMRAHA
jgi:hypothetical protein